MDHKEGWVLKNCYFRILVLEKTPESLGLQGDQIKQPWVFIGKTDTEAEAPVLWPPDVKSWLIWKDSDAAKDWGQEKKRVTENEMVGWHHWLNGHELGQLQKTVKDREAWSAAVHETAKSWIWLSDWKKILGSCRDSMQTGLTLLLLFICLLVSDSLQPHGLQHARPPSPPPSLGVCLVSCCCCSVSCNFHQISLNGYILM